MIVVSRYSRELVRSIGRGVVVPKRGVDNWVLPLLYIFIF